MFVPQPCVGFRRFVLPHKVSSALSVFQFNRLPNTLNEMRCSVALQGALRRSQRFAFSTGAAPTSEAGRIVRFRGKDGEERFGVFSDPQESKCFLAERVEGSPRLRVTNEEVEVDLILPPVDPPSSATLP